MPTVDSETARRIERAIAQALNVPEASLARPVRMGMTPGWDSMGHMMVVLELEREFGTRIPTARLPELLDVDSIARVLALDTR
jgi:acyl carrier protein